MTVVYTDEQMFDATRMADIIKDIPADKQSAFRLMLEAVMLGVRVAHETEGKSA